MFVKAHGDNAILTVYAIVADDDYVFGSGDVGESYIDLATSNIRILDENGNDVTGSVNLIDNGDSITIEGMHDLWQFEINSDDPFSAVMVTGGAGDDFSLSFFSYTAVQEEQPIDLAFDITRNNFV